MEGNEMILGIIENKYFEWMNGFILSHGTVIKYEIPGYDL